MANIIIVEDDMNLANIIYISRSPCLASRANGAPLM